MGETLQNAPLPPVPSGISQGLVGKLRTTLEMIKFEHSIFALPFALVGAMLAVRGWPTWREVFWLIVAMVGARSAAMTFNRIADREIDALNRAVVAGFVHRPAQLAIVNHAIAHHAAAQQKMRQRNQPIAHVKPKNAPCAFRYRLEHERVPPDMESIKYDADLLAPIGCGHQQSLLDGIQHRAIAGVHRMQWFKAEADAAMPGIDSNFGQTVCVSPVAAFLHVTGQGGCRFGATPAVGPDTHLPGPAAAATTSQRKTSPPGGRVAAGNRKNIAYPPREG